MKKMKFMLFAVAAIAAASCAKEITPENATNSGSTELNLIPMIFTAGAEDADTKVALQSDKKTLHWEATDQIKVFDGTSNELPAFTTTGSGASVEFTGSVTSETGPFYALYPYQAGATLGESTITSKTYGTVITATVPSEQIATAGSVPSNAFISAAKSDDKGNFFFKTICGFVKFQLSEEDAAGAVAVSLSGNDLPAIAGNVEIFFTTDGTDTAFGQDYVRKQTKDYVTLKGTFKADTDYYFAIRSNKFAEGFTMTILYADGSSKYVTTTTPAPSNVSRNSVMNIGKPVFKTGLPNDLYIAWQHGLDIDIADQKYNKATYGEATLVKSTSNISTNGVYFVETGIAATVNKNLTSLIIAGRNSSERATVAITKQLKPTMTEGTPFSMAFINADMTYSNTNQVFNLASDIDRIAIDNCSIYGVQHTMINGGENYKADIIAIRNSEIKVAGSNKGAAYIYYTKNIADHTSITLENNVFFYRLTGTTALSDFKVYQNGGGCIKNVTVVRNTFDSTVIPNAGLVKAKMISGEVNISNNLYHNVVAAGAHSNVLGLDTKTGDVLPTGGNITNNFFYKSDSTNEMNLIINRTGLDALEKLGSPVVTIEAILGTDWNPEVGIYTVAENIQYVNSKNETVTVSTAAIGAKR